MVLFFKFIFNIFQQMSPIFFNKIFELRFKYIRKCIYFLVLNFELILKCVDLTMMSFFYLFSNKESEL